MKVFLTGIFLNIILSSFSQNDKSLTIDFESSKYKEGNVFIAIYNTKEAFLKKPLKGTITALKDGKAEAVINELKPGTYAVSAFYDKNNNGKLDTNFLGIPKEPIAMSNDAKGLMGPPKFKDAKFELDEDKRITIKL